MEKLGKIKEENYHEIIELCKTLKQSELAKLFNVSIKSIRSFLKENNIKTNKNRLNLSRLKFDFNYFDEINDEKKAYWLGFIAADGCLKNNKLAISSKDEEVIDKFKKDLQSEHKKTYSHYFDKRTNKTYYNFSIQITSAAFVNKLGKYINIDKSENFLLPDIDENYISFFLAGLIDGDGTFSFDGKRLRVGLSSTKECLIQIQDYVCTKFNLKKTKLHHIVNNVWRFYLHTGSFSFLKFIYDDKFKEIYLSRKFEKYKKILNEKNKLQ